MQLNKQCCSPKPVTGAALWQLPVRGTAVSRLTVSLICSVESSRKMLIGAFLESLCTTNVQPEQGVMLIYDIACQYCIHLRDRIGHLLPLGLDIDQAIGLFHVHAHKEKCFFRFASSFIPGAGIVAGEILESLWAGLNTITPATRTATLAHRSEMIDDHAADSNHKKTMSIGRHACSLRMRPHSDFSH